MLKVAIQDTLCQEVARCEMLADPEDVLWWLPADSETLIVVGGTFTAPDVSSPQANNLERMLQALGVGPIASSWRDLQTSTKTKDLAVRARQPALSGLSSERSVDIARSYWTHPEAKLEPMVEPLKNNGVSITLRVDEEEQARYFLWILMAALGHGLFI